MLFFIWFAGLDSFLLTTVAYDQSVAICQRLHSAMSTPEFCGLVVLASWTTAFRNAPTHTPCYRPACHSAPTTRSPISSVTSAPSCSWPAPTPFSTTWWCTLWAPCPSSPLCGRLGLLRAHLCCCAEDPIHERPEEGLLHLWLSSLWCLIGVYVSPPPMLNPFIYSLSNKDMKGALGALISRKPVFILQPPHGMPEGPNTVPIWTELPCTVPLLDISSIRFWRL